MKHLNYFWLFLLICSCGAVVDYDYEASTDFSSYKTYNYFSDISTGFSELDNKRLYKAIDVKLAALGFTKTDDPSFRIDIQSAEVQNTNNSAVGVGIGGGGRNVGGGVNIGIPVRSNKVQRQVSIEFVDDSKKGMFWQAITTISQPVRATPDEREAVFVKLIEKVFSNYPPKR